MGAFVESTVTKNNYYSAGIEACKNLGIDRSPQFLGEQKLPPFSSDYSIILRESYGLNNALIECAAEEFQKAVNISTRRHLQPVEILFHGRDESPQNWGANASYDTQISFCHRGRLKDSSLDAIASHSKKLAQAGVAMVVFNSLRGEGNSVYMPLADSNGLRHYRPSF